MKKDLSNVEKVISPSGRFIVYLGRTHIKYIVKGLMDLPQGCRLVLQRGHKPNRFAVYRN